MIALRASRPDSIPLRRLTAFLLAVSLGCGAALAGCGGAEIDELSPVAVAADARAGFDPSAAGEPAARKQHPPPAQCDRRHPGVTAMQAVVRIDRYRGLIHGRNGTHEVAYGTIVQMPWVFDAKAVDTRRVELAMNVASATDPTGLPREIALSPGETLEVEGEYIPAAQAHAREGRAAVAVIHYTHAPCGYVAVGGRMYR